MEGTRLVVKQEKGSRGGLPREQEKGSRGDFLVLDRRRGEDTLS